MNQLMNPTDTFTNPMVSGQGWGLEFYDCVVNNDLARLETLVEQHKIDINAKFSEVRKKNHLDLSPIHLVAYKGYTGMLQFLYDMKCDIHLTTATLRRTAFHIAVLRHKVACFHKLLSIGANPDPRDTFGNSPCHYAAEDGALDMLGVLLKHRIDLDAQDITHKTALMKATRNGKIEAVRRLVRAGCSLNVRDKNRDTALHFAARQGSAPLAHVLISGGSDVNIQNQWGHTPLMEAVCYNNKDASATLLTAKCQINQREYKGGESALHIAVRKNYHIICDQFLGTGQVGYVYNYHGELAIYDAVVNQKLETIKIFLRYNYDFDKPIKLEYDGTGGKTVIKIALERGNFELLRLLAHVGFVISYNITPPEAEIKTGPALLLHQFNTAQQGNVQKEVIDADHVAAVKKFLAEIEIVRRLNQMCRRVIRKHIGYEVDRRVQDLPIPTALKAYILLSDML